MRGRPTRKEKISESKVMVRLTTDEFKALEHARACTDLNRSDFLREAIVYYSSLVQEGKKVANA